MGLWYIDSKYLGVVVYSRFGLSTVSCQDESLMLFWLLVCVCMFKQYVRPL